VLQACIAVAVVGNHIQVWYIMAHTEKSCCKKFHDKCSASVHTLLAISSFIEC